MTNKFCNAMNRIVGAIERPLVPVIKVLNNIGVVVMFLVSIFIVVDVLMRALFDSPITGGYELVQFAMVIVVFLPLAFTQHVKGNVCVDMITDMLPGRVQAILAVFIDAVCAVFWGAITYSGILQTIAQHSKNVVSATLRIPVYPIVIILTIGAAFYTIVSLVDILKDLEEASQPKSYFDELKAARNTPTE